MCSKPRESAFGQLPLTRGQQIRFQLRHVIENGLFKTCFPGLLIKKKYKFFKQLLQGDRKALEIISKLEEIKQKGLVCDFEYIKQLCDQLNREVQALVDSVLALNPLKYSLLRNYYRKYAFYVNFALMEDEPKTHSPYVFSLDSEVSEDLAGGKGANLSCLLREQEISIPPGLIINTRAFYLLLETNKLLPLIREQLGSLAPQDTAKLYEVSQVIQSALLDAEIPEKLEKEVLSQFKHLGIEKTALAVRSSAVGEDLQASFAGQFESQLNVSPQEWFTAYKKVLASKYSPHAIYYRMSQGFTDFMTPMAVLVMPTIEARVSGILYTGQEHDSNSASLYMVSGSGEQLASGSRYQAWAKYDCRTQKLESVDPDSPLDPEKLTQVFRLGQKLENMFGTLQDVEWLVDQDGILNILQSRPLRVSVGNVSESENNYSDTDVLARGEWVSSGQTCGGVYKLTDLQYISHIPENAILLTEELPPELTIVLDRVSAIVAAKGSPACHLASVARESGVPAICNTQGLEDLKEGQILSLDSDQGVLLSGQHFDMQSERTSAREIDSPVLQKLGEALKFISPLNLQNPTDEDFTIHSCKSLHDIVRYIHEASVREMFSLVGRRGLNNYGVKRLISGVPLVMHVLNVNKGLDPNSKSKKTVYLEHVQSQPMQQLFAGLSSSAVKWDEDILHYDWDAYAKSNTSFVNVEKSTLFSSYAILDQDYVHALLRFGYHFAVLDSIQGRETEQNYINFSFKGGGGNTEQRYFRIELLCMILERLKFNVQTSADFLEASFDRCTFEDIGKNLGRLGIVLGKTVLLDMRLNNQQQLQSLAEDILQEVYAIFPVQEKA